MKTIVNSLRLKEGRELAYLETGNLQGKPLFLFHGLHSSRLEALSVHDQMLTHGIRLIAIDRPGMGCSTFQENRQVLDIVDDIVALSEHLAIEKFSVLGISSGAKYALACAYKIPERLYSCNIISGAPPMEFLTSDMPRFNRFFINVIQHFPSLIRAIYWFIYGRFSKKSSDSDIFLEHIVHVLGDVDKKLFENPEIKKFLLDAFHESYLQGTKGVAYDAHFDILKSSWGFNIEEISDTPIHFWHGGLDKGVPFSMTKQMIDKIPNATLKFYSEEGHMSLIFNKIDEVMNVLKDRVG